MYKQIHQILGSQLFLNFSFATTDNPNIHLLRIYANASARLLANKELINQTIWEKTYLFENDKQDLNTALKESIDSFASQYFKTNQMVGSKPTFYVFFNL